MQVSQVQLKEADLREQKRRERYAQAVVTLRGWKVIELSTGVKQKQKGFAALNLKFTQRAIMVNRYSTIEVKSRGEAKKRIGESEHGIVNKKGQEN